MKKIICILFLTFFIVNLSNAKSSKQQSSRKAFLPICGGWHTDYSATGQEQGKHRSCWSISHGSYTDRIIYNKPIEH